MPQMSPLSWLTLFFFFILIFIFFNIMNYYCFFYTKKISMNKIKSYYNWKW